MAPVCVIGYSERGKYKMKRDSHYTQDTISMQMYRTFFRDLRFDLSGDTTSVLDESHEVFVRLFSLRSEFGLFALVHAAGLRYEDMNSFRSATHAQYRLYYRLSRHTMLLHLLTTAVSAAR